MGVQDTKSYWRLTRRGWRVPHRGNRAMGPRSSHMYPTAYWECGFSRSHRLYMPAGIHR